MSKQPQQTRTLGGGVALQRVTRGVLLLLFLGLTRISISTAFVVVPGGGVLIPVQQQQQQRHLSVCWSPSVTTTTALATVSSSSSSSSSTSHQQQPQRQETPNGGEGADANEIVARRIVVVGDVQGGYYRSCVLNEVRQIVTDRTLDGRNFGCDTVLGSRMDGG